MGYKDPEQRRKYAREWVAKRRAKFFPSDHCCRCGSTKNLLLHHKDEKTKISHSIWSWSKARRDAEIAKCEVLCRDCHFREHVERAHARRKHGTSSTYKSGCRCAACRLANTMYATQYQRERRPLGNVDVDR